MSNRRILGFYFVLQTVLTPFPCPCLAQGFGEALVSIYKAGAQVPAPKRVYLNATEVWDFENNGIATKNSNHSLNSSTSPPSYTTSIPSQVYGNNAAVFDGVSNRFSLPAGDGKSLDFAFSDNSYSYSFWMKIEPPAISVYGILSNYVGSSGWGSGFAYKNWGGGIEGYYLRVWNYDVGGSSSCYTRLKENNASGNWYHIVVAYNSNNPPIGYKGVLQYWISDMLQFGQADNGTCNMLHGADNNVYTTLFIGYSQLDNLYFPGQIDEIAIWKGRALTAEQAEYVWKGKNIGGWRN